MRLIGTIDGEKEAYRFYFFLKQEGIDCAYEPALPGKATFEFWIMHEDQIEIALHWLGEFKKNPSDPRFETKPHPIDTEGIAAKDIEKEPLEIRAFRLRQKKQTRTPLTHFIALLCAFFYIWNSYQLVQESTMIQPVVYNPTPLMMALSYDQLRPIYHHEGADYANKTTVSSEGVWGGFYKIALHWPQSRPQLDAPLFVKIREGEIWRFITPCFLHENFLYILFNMLWFLLLGRQIEERIKKWQYIAISLIIGAISNTLQYLMDGPQFMGYSGIICGLAGFIWIREKLAPWEGYPLNHSNIYFLGIFIIAMLVLQIVSFLLMRFHIAQFNIDYIANTAHITGALTGIALGRIPLFSKGNL